MRILDRKDGWKWVVIFDADSQTFRSLTQDLLPIFDWVEANMAGAKIRKVPIHSWAIDLKTDSDVLLFKLTWGGHAGSKDSTT